MNTNNQFSMENTFHSILVIEDNQDVLEGIMSILEYYGHQPLGVTRFNDSIFDEMQSRHVSLIILDVMLSGSDGRDLVGKFKERTETKDVPIVMISAYPNIEASVKKAGADDFIQKPFGIDELMQKVDRYLKNGN